MSAKIKYLETRCSYKKEGNVLTIVILSHKTSAGNALFFAWMLCLTFVGLYALYSYASQVFLPKQKVFILVFLAFWLYFIIKIGKAFLWRLYGKEMIRLDEEGMSIKNDIRSYGRSHFTDLDMINKIDLIRRNELSFFDNMSSSYWNISGDKLILDRQGKDIVFAKELNDKSTSALRKVLNTHLQSLRN